MEQQEAVATQVRRPYTKPELVLYGSAQALTRMSNVTMNMNDRSNGSATKT